jgi:RimJ/RimL family protein N-acetyltransferase
MSSVDRYRNSIRELWRRAREDLRVTSDGVRLRPWREEDAAELAAMYTVDRIRIEATEPWRKPGFFTISGQVARSHAWAEYGDLVYTAFRDDRLVGLFMLEDVTSESASVGYFVSSLFRRGGWLASSQHGT